MDEPISRENAIAKLRELIADIATASLTTIDTDGSLRSRPMVSGELDEDGALWFFTSDYAPKVDEVQLHPEVAVTFASCERNRFVSVSGSAEIVRDPEHMRALWKPLLKAWFVHGLDDPDLVLLKVEVATAQYWDAPSNRLVDVDGLMQAIGRGPPGSTSAQNGKKLSLKHRIGSDTTT